MHSSTRPHGIVLTYLSTGTTLPFYLFITVPRRNSGPEEEEIGGGKSKKWDGRGM
jgi:hypothetical protein